MCKAQAVLFAVAVAFLAGAEDNAKERPKVGLVLGGGGALGISHIGVLKVLEEERVPIDYIAGTSMGSIIGGLYASGLSPDEIQAFLQGLDWNNVMSDATPHRELFFRRKFEDQRYLLEVGLGRKGIKMGTGMVAGQKFNNLLQLQVQRSADTVDFDHLSVPFRAVATDLESGTPYVMGSGNLATAMRASMAVPGAFTAVEIDGHLLVDGGIVNNLPVDVAKQMGADIIIAVDVGSKSDKVDREDLESIGGVLGRTYSIMQRPGQLEQLKRADIGIQPQLDDMMASEFARVAEFVPRGKEAAKIHLEAIRKLSVDEETFSAYLGRQRREANTNIVLEAVTMSGEERVSKKAIEGRIRSQAGEQFDETKLKMDLMHIYGIGEFEQVLFQLNQEDEHSGKLNYNVTEKPWGPLYFSLGLNFKSDFDNDTSWGVLMNLTRRSINELGAEWRNDIKIGTDKGFLSEFYQPLDYQGVFFVAPKVEYRDEIQDVYDGKDHIAEYDVRTVQGSFDFGLQWKNIGALRLGPVVGNYQGDASLGLSGLPSFDDYLASLAGSFIIDQKDRTYFAREGYYFGLKGMSAQEDWGSDRSFSRLSLDASTVGSIQNHTFDARLQYSSDLGTDLPGYALFPLGGLESFAGLARYQFRGSTLGVGAVGYRYRLMELPSQLGRGIYTITRYDIGNVWDGTVDLADIRHGVALGVGADTIFGPCYLVYGMANGGFNTVYFSIGTEF